MIELKNICKSYNGVTNIIDDLSMTINAGEFVVLVGESGCGKTTTMQMLNRLITPTSGTITINGEDITTENKIKLRRSIGYVIQNVGLFPHRTIEQNIETVPKLCKKDKNEIMQKTKELLDLVELPYDEYATRYPKELSGGQQQRVGVARALANDPDIILMDEPFSALDPITREQLQDELLRLHDKLDKTIVFVTHDIDEAIKLGDRIAIMQEGKIVQFDSPEELLKKPVNEFVENFIGKDRLWKTPDVLKAEDVMEKNIVKVDCHRTVVQAMERMKKHKTLVLAVVDKQSDKPNKIVGIVGANRFRDVFDGSVKIKDIMKSNITKIPHDMPLSELISIRGDKNMVFNPVVDEDENLVGVITNSSILNVFNQIMPSKEDY